jgi:hypothetical protein
VSVRVGAYVILFVSVSVGVYVYGSKCCECVYV